MSNDGIEIARFDESDRRALFQWTGLVFDDLAAAKTYLDHTDDLTLDIVCNTFLADLKKRGVAFTEPSDPLHDDALSHYSTRPMRWHPKSTQATRPFRRAADRLAEAFTLVSIGGFHVEPERDGPGGAALHHR